MNASKNVFSSLDNTAELAHYEEVNMQFIQIYVFFGLSKSCSFHHVKKADADCNILCLMKS